MILARHASSNVFRRWGSIIENFMVALSQLFIQLEEISAYVYLLRKYKVIDCRHQHS
ncbi:hypothetical protein ACSS6W_005019 [Trichoderma asperelloides]